MCFFQRCSYKNSCFSKMAYNSSVLVLIWWSAAWNQKRTYLKNAMVKMLLWIFCFWFWSYAPSKLLSHFHYGQNSLWASYCYFFLCNFSNIFSYVGVIPVTNHFSLLLIDKVYFGYSANYNIQGAFAILFLICSDLLNVPRSLGTMVITTESG